MCIGIPMQVLSVQEGFAEVSGRGETRRVRTTLLGERSPGEWLLVFLDDAREVIDADRAAEVNATLDLLEAAMGIEDAAGADAAAGFALPSSMDADTLRRLTGHA